MGPLEVLRDSAAQRRLLPWPRAVVGVAALAGGGELLFLVPQQVKASVVAPMALACTFLFAVATTDVAAGVIRTGPSAWAASMLVGSTVVYTVISVLNATAMTMGERAEEIRLLRTVGTKLMRTWCPCQ